MATLLDTSKQIRNELQRLTGKIGETRKNLEEISLADGSSKQLEEAIKLTRFLESMACDAANNY